MLRMIAIVLAGLLLASPVFGQGTGSIIEGPAIARDGGNIVIGKTTIHLWGINTIGPKDPLGDLTADVLRSLVDGKEVHCYVVSIYPGRWHAHLGRRDNWPLALCRVEGRDISAEMLRRGWASAYGPRKMSAVQPRYEDDYEELEAEARAGCRGLWAALPACR